MITLSPLSGPWTPSRHPSADDDAREEEQAPAYAYLVELDDTRILLGCGGNESFSFARPQAAPIDPRARKRGVAPAPAVPVIAHDWEGGESAIRAAARPLDELLLELAPTIDLVLLSHSSLAHLGTLAWARTHAGLTAPVFCTMATQAMGRMTMLSAVRALRAERNVDLEMRVADELDIERGVPGAVAARKDDAPAYSNTDPDAEEAWLHAQALSALTAQRDPGGVQLAEVRTRLAASGMRLRVPTEQQVDDTFDHMTSLRYLQPHRFSSGALAGTTLTAYNAGHSLGGALWKLRSPDQGTILFALDWNHNRERHLDGAALMPHAGDASKGAELRRADVLVTSIGRGRVTNLKRKERDSALTGWIGDAVNRGGSVILPVDPTARTLELLVLLDQHWASTYDSRAWGVAGPRPHLCFVSPSGAEMLERARTLMEWTTREWATPTGTDNGKPKSKHQLQRDAVSSPLDFKNVRVFASVAAMQEELPPGLPKVVLAVHQSGFYGPAMELISKFAAAGDPRDLILLTSRGEACSPLRALWEEWDRRQRPESKWGKGVLGMPVDLSQDPAASATEAAVPPLGAPVPTSEFTLRVDIYSRIKLKGQELTAYEEALAATRAKAAQRRSLVARSRRRMQAEKEEEEASDSDASASDDEVGEDEDLDEPSTGAVPQKRRASQAFPEKDSVRDLVSDIYVRGEAGQIVSFWSSTGRASGAGVRYRMIPSVDKRRRMDAYGELIDKSRWIKRAEELSGQPTDSRELARLERQRAREEEERKRAAAKARAKKFAPAKYGVQYDTSLRLVCQVGYVDNAGLGDGKALAYLLPQLQPRRLVLVGGDARTRNDVRDTLLAIKGMTRQIWAPPLGAKAVVATSADDGVTKSLTVNLQNRLLGHLRWSRFEDYELARMTARWVARDNPENGLPSLAWIEPDAEEDKKRAEDNTKQQATPETQAADTGSKGHDPKDIKNSASLEETKPKERESTDQEAGSGSEERAEAEGEAEEEEEAEEEAEETSMAVKLAPSRVPSTMLIGDLRLSALKAQLARSRVPADFAGDGLLVAGWRTNRSTGTSARAEAVTIRKAGGEEGEAAPQIIVEGNVGQDLVAVRDVVYGMHAQIGQ